MRRSGIKSVLKKEEEIISKGRRSFLDVAAALVRIRDYGDGVLYRDYGTFEAYCLERWEFGRAYAYRLIGAAEIVQELSPRGDVLPSTEKQIRSLSLLESPDDRRKAWAAAIEKADGEEVTSAVVTKVVKSLVADGAKRRTPERKTKPTKSADKKSIIRKELQKILTLSKGTAAFEKVQASVIKIEEYL